MWGKWGAGEKEEEVLKVTWPTQSHMTYLKSRDLLITIQQPCLKRFDWLPWRRIHTSNLTSSTPFWSPRNGNVYIWKPIKKTHLTTYLNDFSVQRQGCCRAKAKLSLVSGWKQWILLVLTSSLKWKFTSGYTVGEFSLNAMMSVLGEFTVFNHLLVQFSFKVTYHT